MKGYDVTERTARFFSRSGAVYPLPSRERTGGSLSLYEAVKRTLDIFVAGVLLLVLWFPMLCIAVAIRCDSRGGAIFRQTRLGKDLAPFTIYKFRTMVENAPHYCPSAALTGEVRRRSLTRVGRFLRYWGLDELPQLMNVLRGEMSLVGPRPLIPSERETHALRAALGAVSVRPGITGLAQTFGRDDCDIETKAYLDAKYAVSASLLLDLRILIRTVVILVRGTGSN